MTKGKRRYIWAAVTALYVLFIFSNSLTPADESSRQSGFVLQTLLGILDGLGLDSIWLTEHIVRKCAHFTEYTVLGLLLFKSLAVWGGSAFPRRLLNVSLGVWIPFVDETLQLFTEGRSGQISDVWLDMSGVAAGTILAWLLGQFLCKTGKKR